ncbi:MAG: menaquinone biosynthesis protein [Nitrospinae bacterium]|nr:menaquinone biosynthesis protein [Nitrospinota bacterium]
MTINNKIRFGYHGFLNSRPLIAPLLTGRIDHNLELICDTPARLADMLKEGEIDMGIIPSIEYARGNGSYLLIPNISISSEGDVDTVLLVGMKRFEDIDVVAVDSGSRTSVVLLRIIFRDRLGREPEMISMEPDLEKMMDRADAALIIGDNAFKVDRSRFNIYDLSTEWYDLTARPFVHAVLAVRHGVGLRNEPELLWKAKEIGSSMIDEIAVEGGERLGITPDICRDYLRNKIIYDLGKKELDSLRFFYSISKGYSLIEEDVEIRFLT